MAKKPSGYWVLRGLRGATARQQYLDYLAGLVDVSAPDGTVASNRPASISLYLMPFNLPLAVDHTMKDTALSPSWDLLKNVAAVNTRVSATTTDTIADVRSYKAPRVVRIGLDNTGEVQRSKRTGLPYTHYSHDHASVPFGAKAGDTSVSVAFSDIATAVNSAGSVKTRLIDERL